VVVLNLNPMEVMDWFFFWSSFLLLTVVDNNLKPELRKSTIHPQPWQLSNTNNLVVPIHHTQLVTVSASALYFPPCPKWQKLHHFFVVRRTNNSHNTTPANDDIDKTKRNETKQNKTKQSNATEETTGRETRGRATSPWQEDNETVTKRPRRSGWWSLLTNNNNNNNNQKK